ncbi:hypothetical protein BZG36_05253 [Bifiguratus adelaidae]|uniref:Exoribonuclease phosphorolytic domain-containing protein n=1 Tax=Bifiguratus adelaidae TaxID=1938954 RepID=A0A261XUM4_9FUNG|nr:hypothetical protein BZG36_05253 [Bifiguratus adelaidae]
MDNLRPLSTTQGVLYGADGSARFHMGSTSVLVSVNGPQSQGLGMRDEQEDRAILDISHIPISGTAGVADKHMEECIRTTFESAILLGYHPRTMIQVIAQTIKDDGGLLAASINATTMALMDAGIPMTAIVAAVTCMVEKETGAILVDQTAESLERAKSIHTFAISSARGNSPDPNVLLLHSLGLFTESELSHCQEAAVGATDAIFAFMRKAVSKKIEKGHQQDGDMQED